MNKNYDFLAIGGFIFTVLWYWLTGKKTKNILGRKGDYYCSEVIYLILKDVEKKTGKIFFSEMDPGNNIPRRIINRV